MMLDDGIPAIPLWIDGHAWFGVFEDFIDICDADGTVNFRVPKCGQEDAVRAIDSALRSHPTWGQEIVLRQTKLKELGGLLDQFSGDFARLIERETGKEFDVARVEVSDAVVLLKNAVCSAGEGGGEQVQTVVSNAVNPLFSVVQGLIRAWGGGAAVVVLSDARAPSVVFALAELSARAEFPAGVFCLLHGDGSAQLALERALSALPSAQE